MYLDDEPLAQIDAGSPEVLTYLHTDHLGTPRFGTNAGGTQVWAWAGDAFGVGTPSGSAIVNLRMSGQYYDSESGLFYNWNRFYNPATGRYISSDPIGIEGGLNTFLYAEASPVMYSDPEGLFAPALVAVGVGTRCAANFACRTAAVHGVRAVGAAALRGAKAIGTAARVNNAVATVNKAEEDTKTNAPSPTAEVGVCPTPEDLMGKTPEEVDKIMAERGWGSEPSSKGGGTRYPNPEVRGEQVRVQPGSITDREPIKRGPYAVISRGGQKVRVPLAGNPTLSE